MRHLPNVLIEDSKAAILRAANVATDLTFIRAYGNIGDELIYAGTRQLLRQVEYREISVLDLQGVSGHTAFLSGSGGWCWPYHDMPKYLPLLESRYERVVILPSSFDVSVPCVRDALSKTKAKVFAREQQSFDQIKNLCDSELACDCAFFYDYQPYRRPGSGILTAYRDDREASGEEIPVGNDDISLTCESLDHWLWTIARHEVVRTDRAHVTIASALLGKKVECRASNYHKLPAIVDYALVGYPVSVTACSAQPKAGTTAAAASQMPSGAANGRSLTDDGQDEASQWNQRLRQTADEIVAFIPADESLVLVDEDQLRELLPSDRQAIPFLERDGHYWGAPLDDAQAVREFHWLREQGADMLVVAWPAFWWLKHYSGWKQYLASNFRCVAENDQFVAFDLRKPAD